MKPKKYKILMDIYKGVLNSQLIEFTTEDHGTCQLEVHIKEDKLTPYNLDGCIVRMVIAGQQQDCQVQSANDGIASITLLQSMFSQTGFTTASIQIYDAINQTLRLTTPSFRYNVKKSMLDDTTAQADPNFSILQNMIIEVTGANQIANQAKATAEAAITKANQAVTTINSEVGKVNKAVTDANAALDRATSVVTQEELNNKVTLDKVAQTNFDFIEGKVVQDGLVKDRPITVPHVVFAKWKGLKTSTYIVSCNIGDSKHGWGIYWNSAYKTFALYAGDGVEQKFYSSNTTPSLDGWLYAIVSDGTIEIITNTGGFKITGINFEVSKIQKTYAYQDPKPADIVDILPYSEINSKVIQHNVSTLNNTPSITQLQTIDAQGKTSISYAIGSDEDHVEMSTGRTLRQEYMGLLKRDGKEFTADASGKIEVNNGLEARVISAEVKGQTVKNYAYTNTVQKTILTTHQVVCDLLQCESSKDYTVIMFVDEMGQGAKVRISLDSGHVLPAYEMDLKIGINSFLVNQKVTQGQKGLGMMSTSSFKARNFMVIEGDVINKVTSYIPFGLSSTQAIISNNGMKYPFYHPTELNEDGIRKVISLGEVGEVCDNLDLKDGGNSVFVQPLKKFNYTGSSDTSMVSLTNTNQFSIKLANVGLAKIASAISSEYNYCNDYSDTVHFLVDRAAIYVHADKVKFPDVDTFNKYCQATPLQFIYQLETPIITNIPKELIQPIQTDKINILSVDSAVKPSSFKATVPVDRVSELQSEMQEFKKQLGAVAALQLDHIN